ncbi:hypothetical protein CAP35_09435 [Chitinophagaceae bacterium IBVUCB1]|nr:hypothetical protein CAP35_09435 [Chitinophagaceae bacterium IBVUCB1]
MKNVLRIEELAMTAISLFALSLLNIDLSWWVYVLVFFAPDISMLGYLINNKAGAISYNIFHHKAVACCVIAIGMIWHNDYTAFAGLMLFAHASFDRIMGYGLKYYTGFNDTHLGQIGRKQGK